jgi:hypothetical protein
MSRCITWRGVHRFEARYDLSPATCHPTQVSTLLGVDPSIIALGEQSRQRTYIHDICVRCGTIVKRDPA